MCGVEFSSSTGEVSRFSLAAAAVVSFLFFLLCPPALHTCICLLFRLRLSHSGLTRRRGEGKAGKEERQEGPNESKDFSLSSSPLGYWFLSLLSYYSRLVVV